jgi:hypothetical protein
VTRDEAAVLRSEHLLWHGGSLRNACWNWHALDAVRTTRASACAAAWRTELKQLTGHPPLILDVDEAGCVES